MMDYIYRAYFAHFHEEGERYFAAKNDTRLFMLLEELANKYTTLTVFASHESFHLVGKVLATLTEDTLVLTNDTLAPSKAKESIRGSYLLAWNTTQINVIEATQNRHLAPLLAKPTEEKTSFSLIGIDEDSCRILLEPLSQTFEVAVHVTPLVEGWIVIDAKSQKYGQIEHFIKSVSQLFGEKMLNTANPIAALVAALIAHDKRITFAESCTGGLLASLITKAPGASACFDGSLVSYSNKLKKAWLSVDAHILSTRGAVSESCVQAMVEGALNASKADIALATSGIAGPDGGGDQKPVGTVFIGIGTKAGDIHVERLLLEGDREYIQTQSAYHALRLLFQTQKRLFFKQ
jgi:nicotinamide-nucleotide amidase